MSTIEHNSKEECQLAFANQFEVAVKRGKWMAAVWFYDDKGLVQVARTTCDFPRSDVETCISVLKNELGKEQTMASVPKPLPLAGPHLMRLLERMPKLDATKNILEAEEKKNGLPHDAPVIFPNESQYPQPEKRDL